MEFITNSMNLDDKLREITLQIGELTEEMAQETESRGHTNRRHTLQKRRATLRKELDAMKLVVNYALQIVNRGYNRTEAYNAIKGVNERINKAYGNINRASERAD